MAKNDKYADRAKIFMPFDALKGYKEALGEKEKVVVEKIELYYENDEYIEVFGLISKIDYQSEYLVVVKKKIFWNNIYRINVYNEHDEEIEVE